MFVFDEYQVATLSDGDVLGYKSGGDMYCHMYWAVSHERGTPAIQVATEAGPVLILSARVEAHNAPTLQQSLARGLSALHT